MGTVNGTIFNDSLSTGGGSDLIYAGLGNDTVTDTGGNDSIYGGDGNDRLNAGDGAADSVFGGNGNDTLTSSGSDADSAWGDAGADFITMSDGANQVFGGSEADTISALGGHDTVFAGSGNDSVTLGAGNDSFGSWGADDSGDDTIYGGLGQDSIIGGGGNDQVYGDDGNDVLSGQHGSDTLFGGVGNDIFTITDDHEYDRIDGGTGTDTVEFSNFLSTQGIVVTYTGAGTGSYDFVGTAGLGNFSAVEVMSLTGYDDTLFGGADTAGMSVFAGAGNDSVFGGGGNNAVYGGDGRDTLSGGGGNDTLDGGAGNDRIDAGSGHDLTYGDAGNDTIQFGSGNDTVYGGDGDDVIDDVSGTNENGANLVDAGLGNDTVWAGNDNDSVLGGGGHDNLMGEGGNDTLSGGAGNDTLQGGSGRDVFELSPTGGADRISDFGMTLTSGQTEDQLDVSDLTNGDGSPVKSYDVLIGTDGSGNAVLTFPGGETLVLQGVSAATVAASGKLAQMGVPCFAAGTRLQTPGGMCPVEALQVGDLVWADAGPLPVLWHGMRAVDAATLADQPDLRPIRIKQGQFGAGRDLILSPQHGVRVGDVLIRARHLACGTAGVHVARGIRAVTYHHILLPQHALVRAEGVACESFYPGRLAVAALPRDQRFALIRALGQGAPTLHGQGRDWLERRYGPRCLPLVSGRQARALMPV